MTWVATAEARVATLLATMAIFWPIRAALFLSSSTG